MKFDPKELSARTITFFVLALLAVIFILQNFGTIDFKILFIKISMPSIIFSSLLLVIGFAGGLLYKGRRGK